MANKTAMQKLIDYMRANFHLTENSEIEFTDSLAMEREEIENAFVAGDERGTKNIPLNAEQYYTQTFKND